MSDYSIDNTNLRSIEYETLFYFGLCMVGRGVRVSALLVGPYLLEPLNRNPPLTVHLPREHEYHERAFPESAPTVSWGKMEILATMGHGTCCLCSIVFDGLVFQVVAVGWDAWCWQPRGWGGAVRAVFEEVRLGHGSEMGGETDAGDS